MEQEDEHIERPTEPLLAQSAPSEPESNVKKFSKNKLLLTAGPGILFCLFTIAFDISFLSTNYDRRIASSLHQLNNAVWIILAGSIADTACQVIHAHIGSLWGHRLATLIAASLTTLGLLLCSLSSNLWELAISRIVMGSGSSGLQLLAIIMLKDLVNLKDLALFRSCIVVIEFVGYLIGGPVGSSITEKFGWRVTFRLEFCLMVFGIILVFLTLRPTTTRSAHSDNKGEDHVDFFGSVVLLIAVAVPLVAINIGGNIIPWDHPNVIALLCATPLIIFLFYFVETHVAVTPILPMKLLGYPAVIALLVCAFSIVCAFNMLLYNFALYVNVRSFESPSWFNEWATSFIFAGRPVGVVLSGILLRRYPVFWRLLQGNVVVNVVLYLLLATGWIPVETPGFAPYLFALGFNLGVSESCLIVSLFPMVRREDQPALLALFNLSVALSGDVGVGVSLSLERTFAKSGLRSRLHNIDNIDEVIRQSTQSLDYIRQLPAETRRIVIEVFVSSIEKVFAISCAVLLAGVVAVFAIRRIGQDDEEDLDGLRED